MYSTMSFDAHVKSCQKAGLPDEFIALSCDPLRLPLCFFLSVNPVPVFLGPAVSILSPSIIFAILSETLLPSQ